MFIVSQFFCGSVVQKWLSWMVQAQGLSWGCWSRLQLSISLTGAGGSASTGWLIFGFNHSICIPLSGANWLSSWRGRVICYHFHHILFIQNELLKKKKEKKWVANSCSLWRIEELNSISWKEECYRTWRSSPGSSVHGIVQARILEWVAIPFSRGSSQPRNQTWVSYNAGRFFTISAI